MSHELRSAARAFESHKAKTGNKLLHRGEMGYTLTLSRVTGAKQVRPPTGPGPAGGVYEYGLSVVVQFKEKDLTWIVVELEATCEARGAPSFRASPHAGPNQGEPYLVVTGLEVLKESTRSGWGVLVAEIMMADPMAWDDALPLPF